MINKKLTIIGLFSLISLTISACNTIRPVKNISIDTPYYSVTTGKFDKDRNAYMNYDIKIPKITYSNSDGNELIDALNLEIETSLTKLIDDAKARALNTYETYLQSAKDNAKKDIENKIADLESKYKSVIGQEEKDILSKLNADDLDSFSFSNMSRRNTFSNLISSYSETTPRFGKRYNFDGNFSNNNQEETISGHSNSDDIIIPGLHNKNIIIVETTTAAATETTIKISGRPGIAPSENGNIDFSDRPKRASRSNMSSNNQDVKTGEKFNRNTDITFESKNDKLFPNAETVKATVSETTTSETLTDKIVMSEATSSETAKSDELTLDDFYRELRSIRRFNVPGDFYLTMQYIPTTIACNYEIKCLDEDYLSLFVELTESRTTTNVKRLFYNVDLNKKKIISLKDVLGDKYKETIVKCINEAIDKWNDEQKATLIENYSVDNYINENTPFFINNNHKPVVEIEKFAITIGSTGYHEFQIVQ